MSPLDAGILVGLPAVLLFPLDPIAGILSDRVRSRVGRRRIFLVTCGPFASVCFFLRFYVPPGWSASVLFTYWFAVQIAYSVANTVHCKLDKVGHRSPCPPRNGTGVTLLETNLRVGLASGNGPEAVLISSYPEMSKIVQLLGSC